MISEEIGMELEKATLEDLGQAKRVVINERQHHDYRWCG